MKILIIDDEPVNVALLEEILVEAGTLVSSRSSIPNSFTKHFCLTSSCSI